MASDVEYKPTTEVLQTVNSKLDVLGLSPMKRQKLNKEQLRTRALRKIEDVQKVVKMELERGLNIDLSKPGPSTENVMDNLRENSESLVKLVENLKRKFDESDSYEERIRLLTLVPEHWSNQRIEKEFECTNYIVRQARELKERHGILGTRPKKLGRPILDSVKKSIIEFYCDDRNSRMCPGAKEFISTKNLETGKKEHIQKRLLLFNVRDLYEEWKKELPETVGKAPGFSTFASLRPPYCVLAGSPGTHTVCVCTHHQNVKLKVKALADNSITSNTLMSAIVCSIEERECICTIARIVLENRKCLIC